MNKSYIQKLKENATIPTQGSKYAAGYDLYACLDEDIIIAPGEVGKIGTGIAITPPEGTFGAIYARSGLATKSGLRPANCVGVCDYDYTGEYIVPLRNDDNVPHLIKNGDRIAQLVFAPYFAIEFEEVNELKPTKRGAGGFGSTGINN